MYDIQIFQPHGENEIGNGALELNAPNSPREGLKKKRKVDSASQGVEVPILKTLFNYHNTLFLVWNLYPSILLGKYECVANSKIFFNNLKYL